MNSSDNLWRALDHLDEWGKCGSVGQCLLSLIANGWWQEAKGMSEVTALAETIKEQFPGRGWNGGPMPIEDDFQRVWLFNDNEETTVEDVRLVVEKTAIRLDEVLS